jgi:hypothetical protein
MVQSNGGSWAVLTTSGKVLAARFRHRRKSGTPWNGNRLPPHPLTVTLNWLCFHVLVEAVQLAAALATATDLLEVGIKPKAPVPHIYAEAFPADLTRRRQSDLRKAVAFAQLAHSQLRGRGRTLLFQQVTWKSPIFYESDLLNTWIALGVGCNRTLQSFFAK